MFFGLVDVGALLTEVKVGVTAAGHALQPENELRIPRGVFKSDSFARWEKLHHPVNKSSLPSTSEVPEKGGVLVLVTQSALVAGEDGFYVKTACKKKIHT